MSWNTFLCSFDATAARPRDPGPRANSEGMSPPATHALRSIIREAVSNTIRHSGASRLSVQLGREAGRARLVIADNGHGFDRKRVSAGNGLSNIESRSETLGGQMTCDSSPGGTRIEIRFPLKQPGVPA